MYRTLRVTLTAKEATEMTSEEVAEFQRQFFETCTKLGTDGKGPVDAEIAIEGTDHVWFKKGT